MSWKLKEFERAMYMVLEVIDEDGNVVKTFVADDLTYKEKKRKAQLMAAAPELLEVLEGVEQDIIMNGEITDDTFQAVKGIINKAKGVGNDG